MWVICALVFLLGLLIGVFLTAGGRRKWKDRYKDEVERRAGSRSACERARDMGRAREGMARARLPARARAIKDEPRAGDGESARY